MYTICHIWEKCPLNWQTSICTVRSWKQILSFKQHSVRALNEGCMLFAFPNKKLSFISISTSLKTQKSEMLWVSPKSFGVDGQQGKKNILFNDLTIKYLNNLTWQSSENIRAEYCNGKIFRGETGTCVSTNVYVHLFSVYCHSQHSILNSLPGPPMCVAWCIILHCLSKCGFSWNLRVSSKHLRRGWFVSSSP